MGIVNEYDNSSNSNVFVMPWISKMMIRFSAMNKMISFLDRSYIIPIDITLIVLF